MRRTYRNRNRDYWQTQIQKSDSLRDLDERMSKVPEVLDITFLTS